MCRWIIFTHSADVSALIWLWRGADVSSALRHLAFTPPSHLSFRLGGTADRGERTGRALKYIAAGCGHMSPMSTGKLSAYNHHNAPDKNSCSLSLAPGYKYWQQNLDSPCKKHKLTGELYWSLRAVSGQCPSGWRVFYLFHEFPFILSRAEPSRARGWPGPGLST